jgi:glycosyltransferase involved in cell wall biosynthesis
MSRRPQRTDTVVTMSPPSKLTTSVVICAFSHDRWEALCTAVASLRTQATEVTATILVIDHNPDLLRRATLQFGGIRVIENRHECGLSGARNTGVDAAEGEIVAFLDDDAVADPAWLARLTAPYTDPTVIGTGGVARPLWEGGGSPRWLPQEFYWVVAAATGGSHGTSHRFAIRSELGCHFAGRLSTWWGDSIPASAVSVGPH